MMTGYETPPIEPHAYGAPGALGAQPLKTGLAVTTLVLGIVGLAACPLTGIVAVVLGIIALNKISKAPQVYGGKGMAIGGLTCGAVSMCTVPLLLSILLPSLSRARELSKRLVCAANMTSIGNAVATYSNNFPGQGSPTLNALVQRGDITQQVTVCPSSSAATSNYVLLPIPAGQTASGQTVLAYEPLSNHAGEGGNVLFLDGHVSFERVESYRRLMQQLPGQPPP